MLPSVLEALPNLHELKARDEGPMTVFLASFSLEIPEGGERPWPPLHGHQREESWRCPRGPSDGSHALPGAPRVGELGQGLLGWDQGQEARVSQPLALWLQSQLLGASVHHPPASRDHCPQGGAGPWGTDLGLRCLSQDQA